MTRKLLHFILAIAVLLSISALAQNGSAAAPSVPAPAPTTTKIGIINIQEAIFATNEGRRDFEALNKKFEPKQGELQTVNKEIDDLKKQLTAQGDKLNEDAKAVQVRQIEQKQKSLQRSYEDAQAEFQGQQNEILNRIGQKLLGVLDKYAKDNGYTLILDVSSQQSPVLWAGPSSNVTEPIVNAYNAQSGVPAPASSARPSAGVTRPSGVKPATPSSTPRPATPAPQKPAGTTPK